MKNKSVLAMTVFSLCMLAAVPANAAGISGDALEGKEEVHYIVDFLDDDGSILDSKICTYGEVLEEIRTPDQREDEQYIYQFARWEPEISEVVTESALYTAVYQRISKTDGEVSVLPREIAEGIPAASGAEDFYPDKEVQQVSATSYDIVSFHIETEEEADTTDETREESPGVPVFTNAFPETIFLEETVNEQIAILPEERPEEKSKVLPAEETLTKTESIPVVWTEVYSPAENLVLAEEPENAEAFAADTGGAEPNAAPKTAVTKNNIHKGSQSPPAKHTDTEDFALRESKTERPFSIPVFLAGTVVGGAVCMRGRRAL